MLGSKPKSSQALALSAWIPWVEAEGLRVYAWVWGLG